MIIHEYYVLKLKNSNQNNGYVKTKFGDKMFKNLDEAKAEAQFLEGSPYGKCIVLKRSIVEEVVE